MIELIKAQQEYIELLIKAIDDVTPIATIHGYIAPTTSVHQARNLRTKIEGLSKKIPELQKANDIQYCPCTEICLHCYHKDSKCRELNGFNKY